MAPFEFSLAGSEHRLSAGSRVHVRGGRFELTIEPGLRMSLSDQTLQMSPYISRSVQFDPEASHGDDTWTCEPFTFSDEPPDAPRTSDGCLFTIGSAAPGGRNSIWVVRQIQPATMQEAMFKGSGFWLGHSPAGHTYICPVDDSNRGTVVSWKGRGWVNTWIAREGAEIVDITTPPFTTETEEVLQLDHTSVPATFWAAYKRLRNLTN